MSVINSKNEFVEMIVMGLVVDPSTNSPIIILKDINSNSCLPIWIGPSEATSIAVVLKGLKLSRPLGHDLFKTTLELLNAEIVSVRINSLVEDTFFSEIIIKSQNQLFNVDSSSNNSNGVEYKSLDARPSDSISLALRFGAPIFTSKEVLEKSKGIIVPLETLETQSGLGVLEIEVLDDVKNKEVNNLNSFNKFNEKDWSNRFKSLMPSDFKYKI
jgi:bifunctional DNase/RNase